MPMVLAFLHLHGSWEAMAFERLVSHFETLSMETNFWGICWGFTFRSFLNVILNSQNVEPIPCLQT